MGFENKENSKQHRSLVLYHGSKSGITGSIKPNSREHCDFGRGFYMGDTERQPLTLICAYPKATLYTVRFDPEGLAMLEVPPGIDWAMLVAFSRGKLEKIRNTPLYQKYEGLLAGQDAVCGSIANDRMFYREQGIHSANEICKQHRRDGQFFDELLAQGDNV